MAEPSTVDSGARFLVHAEENFLLRTKIILFRIHVWEGNGKGIKENGITSETEKTSGRVYVFEENKDWLRRTSKEGKPLNLYVGVKEIVLKVLRGKPEDKTSGLFVRGENCFTLRGLRNYKVEKKTVMINAEKSRKVNI